MKTARFGAVLVFVVAICCALTFAEEPGRHPAYLTALTDLRDARAHLSARSASDRVDNLEQHAVEEIDKAIGEIKHAAIDDGKNLDDHPPVDANLERKGRFHRAMELLDKAHKDIAQEEDDASTHGLRDRATRHIDAARSIVAHLL